MDGIKKLTRYDFVFLSECDNGIKMMQETRIEDSTRNGIQLNSEVQKEGYHLKSF